MILCILPPQNLHHIYYMLLNLCLFFTKYRNLKTCTFFLGILQCILNLGYVDV